MKSLKASYSPVKSNMTLNFSQSRKAWPFYFKNIVNHCWATPCNRAGGFMVLIFFSLFGFHNDEHDPISQFFLNLVFETACEGRHLIDFFQNLLALTLLGLEKCNFFKIRGGVKWLLTFRSHITKTVEVRETITFFILNWLKLYNNLKGWPWKFWLSWEGMTLQLDKKNNFYLSFWGSLFKS